MEIHEKNWKNKELENHYLYLYKYYNDYLFKKKFGSYYSSKVTLQILRKNPKLNILEVGIGAGNFYRLLKIHKLKNNYLGADISENYVNLSKKLNLTNSFILTDELISKNLEKNYDVVYCRNVLLHQTDPYIFLNNLIEKSKFFLIIELTTRDLGETNLDVKKSCQLVDGVWVPYIVLNYNELVKYLSTHRLCKNSKIYTNRDYHVLGGKNGRFLEKELYLEKTKTANTTIKIEFNSNNAPPLIHSKNITNEVEKNITNEVEFFETFKRDDVVNKNFFYYLNLITNKLRSIRKHIAYKKQS